MTNAPVPNPELEGIDRLLDAHLASGVEELAPSSGFVASVMESIQAQAAEPPPIAFPWRRVVPGAIAVVCGLVAFLVFVVREWMAAPAVAQTAVAALPRHLALPHAFTQGEVLLGWILVGACLSIAAVAASFRLTGRSE